MLNPNSGLSSNLSLLLIKRAQKRLNFNKNRSDLGQSWYKIVHRYNFLTHFFAQI